MSLEEWLARCDGVVGLVFTDVVDSTTLLFSRETIDFRAMLRRHRQRAAELVGQGDGRLIEATGDGRFAAFPGAEGACGYALGLHADSGQEGLFVRAGVHFGSVRADGDALVGRSVYLAARVIERGEGREVWVSEAAKAALEAGPGSVAATLSWETWEDCALKGVPDPCRLWRVA